PPVRLISEPMTTGPLWPWAASAVPKRRATASTSTVQCLFIPVPPSYEDVESMVEKTFILDRRSTRLVRLLPIISITRIFILVVFHLLDLCGVRCADRTRSLG